MTITEVKQILKEMKEIIKFEDNKTEIIINTNSYDPFVGIERVHIETKINNIRITATSEVKNKRNKENK